ncbi:hypothetical protein JHK87_055631 [Glycine soja]|nr:hypothetical protein JHK87_055631 [Glycine soja]
MGLTVSPLLRLFYARKEMRILMVGLDVAGKPTILYKLKLGEIVTTTIPTIGSNLSPAEMVKDSFEHDCGVEDWIAIGDGKGNMAIIGVVNDDCTPTIRLCFTWVAKIERQLLEIKAQQTKGIRLTTSEFSFRLRKRKFENSFLTISLKN